MKMIEQLPDMRRSDGSLKKSTALYTQKLPRFFITRLPILNTFANKPTNSPVFPLQCGWKQHDLLHLSDIMEACDIKDKNTISSTLKQLMEMEVIVKVSTSRYMLNPAVALQGNNQKFGMLASHFNALVLDRKRRPKNKERN